MTKIQYTPQQKIDVLKTLDRIQNVRQTARIHDIKSPKTIREWRRDKPKIMELQRQNKRVTNNATRKRLFGGGCKPKFRAVEKELNDWIDARRKEKLAVTPKTAIDRAIFIHKSSSNSQSNFKASRGWLQRYFKRFHRSLRRRTHLATQNNKTPTITRNIVLEHLTSLSYLASLYEKKNIFNMDETPLYVDMPATTTIEYIGEKTVDVVSGGYEKHRISVVLTICANGSIAKTFVIMQKLLKAPKVNLPNNIHLSVSKSGFMDCRLMREYLNEIIKPITSRNGEIILLMDELSSHHEDRVLALMKEINARGVFLPPNHTSELQLLDVSVNHPFKTAFRSIWENYMLTSEPEFTNRGNRKKISYQMQVDMISSALSKINHMEMISKSFIASGFSIYNNDQQRPILANFNRRLQKIFDDRTDWNQYFATYKQNNHQRIEERCSSFHINAPPKKRKNKQSLTQPTSQSSTQSTSQSSAQSTSESSAQSTSHSTINSIDDYLHLNIWDI